MSTQAHGGFMRRLLSLALGSLFALSLAACASRCPTAQEVVRVSVLEGVNFEFDRAALLPSASTLLDENVDFLKSDSSLRVRIEGHCDLLGSDSYNQKLSEDRTLSVYNYLKAHGVESFRMSTEGYGRKKPVADNDTEEGRAKNRRVELVIVRGSESFIPGHVQNGSVN